MRSVPLGLFALALTASLALSGCRRGESRAAEPRGQAWQSLATVEMSVPGVGRFMLPRGWHFAQGAYPGEIPDQRYQMVRATYDRRNEDKGLLSIDISPSHPRLFRKPLSDHVASRLKGLSAGGAVTQLPEAGRELPYEAEERMIDVGGELVTFFRVFRQKSRVVTVAFTAGTRHFDKARAIGLVHQVSESLLIELPEVTIEPPSLDTRPRSIAGVVSAMLPGGFELVRRRSEFTLVPTEVFELQPEGPGYTDDDTPTLTLSVLRLSILGPGVEVEGLAVPPGGQEFSTGSGERHATIIEVDHDTLAAMRVVRVGGDVLTITYAAPDYLFAVKPALELLDRIAQSAVLAPLTE